MKRKFIPLFSIVILCFILASCCFVAWDPGKFRISDELVSNDIKEINYIILNTNVPVLKYPREINQPEADIDLESIEVITTLDGERITTFFTELSKLSFWVAYPFNVRKYPETPFGQGAQIKLTDGSFYLITYYNDMNNTKGGYTGRIDLYDKNGGHLRCCSNFNYAYDFEALMLKYFDNYIAILPELPTSSGGALGISAEGAFNPIDINNTARSYGLSFFNPSSIFNIQTGFDCYLRPYNLFEW